MGIRAGLAVVAAVLLYSSVGAANKKFPSILAARLHMPCAPTCLVCHDSLDGGINRFRIAAAAVALAGLSVLRRRR